MVERDDSATDDRLRADRTTGTDADERATTPRDPGGETSERRPHGDGHGHGGTSTGGLRGRLFGGRRARSASGADERSAPSAATREPTEALEPDGPIAADEAVPAPAEVVDGPLTGAPVGAVREGSDDPLAGFDSQRTSSPPDPAEVPLPARAAGAGRGSVAVLFQAPPALPEPEPSDEHERPSRARRGDRQESEGQGDADEAAGGSSRRRRRRAGSGGSSASEPSEDGSRRDEPAPITEPQRVKGSTRLEAKKQRRRDGRDAGRRRTVVTEAEFLARRESVDRAMVVRASGGRTQIGVLEDGVLVEHYVARAEEASLIGNVYLGRVQNVLPSMEAAFVDIGRGRNAVLYSGEVDWDGVELDGQPRRIELALKPGDRVLVQVTKDPVGHKGARLTSQVSLPGRYLVYVPGGSSNGISRKLPDTERARLKRILKEVLPAEAGVIVRTAAEGATEEQLTLDVTRLADQWEAIRAERERGDAPALLHSEPDLVVKIVRDVFNEDFARLVIAGDDVREVIERYLGQVAPDLVQRIETYEGDRDVFDEHRVSEQIAKALERKVWLPSGGSLVIDRTEAMTVVDVNTGKFVGSGGNLEETVTMNNLEAAEEIVRQLRLRDIGGIIVVDFIDMVLESNRDLVLRRLVECLSRDRTKHQVAEVTSLGLVQMTRKKLGLGLLETFSEPCETCAGRGVIVHHDPVERHRGGETGSRRSRGGRQQSPSPSESQRTLTVAQAHAITDDAKKGLAQIAASTLTSAASAEAAEAVESARAAVQDAVQRLSPPAGASRREADGDDAAQADTARHAGPDAHEDARADAQGTSSIGSRRSRRSRRARSGGDGAAGGAEARSSAAVGDPDAATRPVEPASTPEDGGGPGHADTGGAAAERDPSGSPDRTAPTTGVLASPGSAPERDGRTSGRSPDADALLGTVLDSLPAPRAAGRGRSRSRRVTTGSMTADGRGEAERRRAE